MRVLIYKRTHIHDPRTEGIFGIENCMGKVRTYSYDAVIGVGAVNAIPKTPKNLAILRKVNWIGIGVHRTKLPDGMLDGKGRQWSNAITFDHFELYEGKGQPIEPNYSALYTHLYGNTPGKTKTLQFCIIDLSGPNVNANLKTDICKILKLRTNAPFPLTVTPTPSPIRVNKHNSSIKDQQTIDKDVIAKCQAESDRQQGVKCGCGCDCDDDCDDGCPSGC